MTAEQILTTLVHLDETESQSNFRRLQKKWSRWRLSESEHQWLDMTECRFIGEGNHEIAVFTFSRHLRLSRLMGRAEFPVWVAAGPTWSDRWHDMDGMPYRDLPIIGIFRGIGDSAGFLEPFRVLAVIGCANAQFVYDELAKRVPSLSDEGQAGRSTFGNPRFRQIQGPIKPLLDAVAEVTALPCPLLRPIAPTSTGACVSISLDDLCCLARSFQSCVETVADVLGQGKHVVYAYTFSALEDAASLAGDEFYPVKVGWARVAQDVETPSQAATSRVLGQVVLPEPVRIIGLLACSDGPATEARLHRRLKPRRITAIAKEWFASNRGNIHRLMKEYAA